MRSRCENARLPYYPRYGGRNIRVCDRWQTFEGFFADMGISYEAHVARFGEKDTSIDRIDNESGYSPENCRWATMKEQRANRRKI